MDEQLELTGGGILGRDAVLQHLTIVLGNVKTPKGLRLSQILEP